MAANDQRPATPPRARSMPNSKGCDGKIGQKMVGEISRS